MGAAVYTFDQTYVGSFDYPCPIVGAPDELDTVRTIKAKCQKLIPDDLGQGIEDDPAFRDFCLAPRIDPTQYYCKKN